MNRIKSFYDNTIHLCFFYPFVCDIPVDMINQSKIPIFLSFIIIKQQKRENLLLLLITSLL